MTSVPGTGSGIRYQAPTPGMRAGLKSIALFFQQTLYPPAPQTDIQNVPFSPLQLF